jgi:hypothetical protein
MVRKPWRKKLPELKRQAARRLMKRQEAAARHRQLMAGRDREFRGCREAASQRFGTPLR